MTVYEAARAYRRALARGDEQAARRIVAAWQRSLARIEITLDALTAEIEAAEEAGTRVHPAWVFQRDRYKLLESQIVGELGRFVGIVDDEATRAQAQAAGIAGQMARDLASLQLNSATIAAQWAHANPVALANLIGASGDGPLRDLFVGLSPAGAMGAREALEQSVALSLSPRETAAAVKRALNVPLYRALTIVRTEQMRAFREASRLEYAANPHLVEGWVWLAARDGRCCAFCWSMNGSHHAADEPMATHPNCRCTMVPRTFSWDELGMGGLGLTGAGVSIPDGEEAFARAPASLQLQVLGPGKYAAYERGDLSLADLRGFRDDPRWGRVGFEKPLRDVVAA